MICNNEVGPQVLVRIGSYMLIIILQKIELIETGIFNGSIWNKMKVSVENREFTIIVEEEPEGRGFSGQCKELPTAISQGKTLEELEENIKDAIQLVLDIQEDRF